MMTKKEIEISFSIYTIRIVDFNTKISTWESFDYPGYKIEMIVRNIGSSSIRFLYYDSELYSDNLMTLRQNDLINIINDYIL